MSNWRASSVMKVKWINRELKPNPKAIKDENLSLALRLCGWDSEDGGNGRQITAKN
jgi:hypothetical protein